jgi:hypothetical protein
MPDRPYTDDDLRAEAARQHAALTQDPDFMGVGEQMDGTEVSSLTTDDDDVSTGETWDELLPYNHDDGNAFNEAQRKIHKLISGAADVSGWAVALGADGLEPVESVLTLQADGRPIVRVHFAFDPDMPDEMRNSFVEGTGSEIARYL